jgi:hypothetical protein
MTPERWPEHGTLVYVSECDHLTWKQTKPYVEHSWTLGRVYRYYMWLKGLRIYVRTIGARRARKSVVCSSPFEVAQPTARGRRTGETPVLRAHATPLAAFGVIALTTSVA